MAMLELTDDGKVPVYFISTNKSKTNELKMFFDLCTNIELRSLQDFPVEFPEIDEPFTTFDMNAKHKAFTGLREIKRLIFKRVNVIADDSGLTIDAFGSYPGVITKRFVPNSVKELIKDLSPEEAAKVRRDVLMWFMDMFGRIKSSPEIRGRKAHYDSALHMIIPLPSNNVYDLYAKGTLEGTIVESLDDCRGNNGFTFDQIFIPSIYDDRFNSDVLQNKTLAELSTIEKLRISHRGKSLMNLMEKLTQQDPKLGFEYYPEKLMQ